MKKKLRKVWKKIVEGVIVRAIVQMNFGKGATGAAKLPKIFSVQCDSRQGFFQLRRKFLPIARQVQEAIHIIKYIFFGRE